MSIETKMRFCTVEDYDGGITAYCEQQQDEIDKHVIGRAAGWIWQWAENRRQAIEQHHEKHAEWEADMEAGRKQKDTY